MCGICGIYHYKSSSSADKNALSSMNSSLIHRGPDDEGYYLEGPVGIAMRRLIIIDPKTGNQPFRSEDGKIVLVCNGEIYNFRDLREQLIHSGHKFSSRSDCEVILHLYEDMGVNCLEKLKGMFAFAVWDSRTKKLFIARDRIGIKPLYYADFHGTFLFGSEIKAILSFPELSRSLSPEGLHHYLSLNYVPAPFTLIEEVKQLLPGEYLICSEKELDKTIYWDLKYEEDQSLSEDQWASKVSEKLEACVASHLVSDVPFGAFLSGGIDSSAVVGYMSRLLDEPVQTFSIDFKEKSYSEARYAKKISDIFKSHHSEIRVEPNVVSILKSLIWHADDPLADSSMIPVYLLAKFAKEKVTMVLTGDGGDEVFAGYDTYNAYYVRNLYRKLPAWLRKNIIKRAVEALPVSQTKVSFDFKAKRFVSGAELDAEEAHFWWRVILTESAKNDLYSAEFKEAIGIAEVKNTSDIFKKYFSLCGSDDPLSRMLYVDTRLYLPADMLVKVDRMTMANALEARVPFLDHELVELAARIPSSIKFKQRKKKYILKKALESLLPKETLRRKKAGFNVPVNVWLPGELKNTVEEILSDERLGKTRLFNMKSVRRLLKEHTEKKHDHSYAIWSLMSFQIWYEMFIHADRVAPPEEVAKRWNPA